MAADVPRPISILIAALGGQGGGVLTDWIVGAAEHAGLPAQATSTPGVAQRTGATTYYVEVYPVVTPPGAPRPVFSLYPTPGDVDVIVASEFLEAGRTLELDYASPTRTTLVASSHRLFAIGERSALGDGIFPAERLREAARTLTRRTIVFDALDAARSAGSEVNAVLLGAFAATGALPLPDSAFETAIREGVAAEKNLAGFRAGREIATLGTSLDVPRPAARPWGETRAARAAALGRRGPAFLALCAKAEAALDLALHPTVGEALARLIDYQDARYAERWLGLVDEIRAVDPDTRLTERVARRLALWATYEDAIRVADLKTRRSRFARIRAEQAAPEGAVLVVTDYLKPDLDEIYGLLPAAIGGRIARCAEARWPEERPALGQHVRTTTVLGFLRVWGLGRLRFLRPRSLRAAREWALIERWRRAVLECAAVDTELAIEVAETAAVVRGYGGVRRRLAAAFGRLLDEIVAPAVARDRAAGAGYARSRRIVAEARRLLLADEQGIGAALNLVVGTA
ncbi:MAG TPA: indolepyruvate oxidoreductase subunit beta family protein [Methylomirabilota bacterium]|nr:indolepyruvate oxidoreductase subunit beta family protein [Methylomirabilota bacterium]